MPENMSNFLEDMFEPDINSSANTARDEIAIMNIGDEETNKAYSVCSEEFITSTKIEEHRQVYVASKQLFYSKNKISRLQINGLYRWKRDYKPNSVGSDHYEDYPDTENVRDNKEDVDREETNTDKVYNENELHLSTEQIQQEMRDNIKALKRRLDKLYIEHLEYKLIAENEPLDKAAPENEIVTDDISLSKHEDGVDISTVIQVERSKRKLIEKGADLEEKEDNQDFFHNIYPNQIREKMKYNNEALKRRFDEKQEVTAIAKLSVSDHKYDLITTINNIEKRLRDSKNEMEQHEFRNQISQMNKLIEEHEYKPSRNDSDLNYEDDLHESTDVHVERLKDREKEKGKYKLENDDFIENGGNERDADYEYDLPITIANHEKELRDSKDLESINDQVVEKVDSEKSTTKDIHQDESIVESGIDNKEPENNTTIIEGYFKRVKFKDGEVKIEELVTKNTGAAPGPGNMI